MKKAGKTIGILLLVLVLVAALGVGGYVGYVALEYDRIPDYTPLTVEEGQDAVLQVEVGYTATTFNIGFGAYDHAFSFFMDSGVMNDGTTVKGKSAKAASEAVVRGNTQGVISALQQIDADFVLLQEVDTAADRSWGVDQLALIGTALDGYSQSYASNFHTAYLHWPLNDPIGKIESGIVTLSRYRVRDAVRRSFPVDDSFPDKFFDLDRCFSVYWLPVEGGGELALFNVHMSAYDEGGQIRAEQMELLFAMMADEYAKGNYVIVGGDFNHALGDTINAFGSGQQIPDWVVAFPDGQLPAGFRVVNADNDTEVATCRSSDMAYTAGVNYTTVIDGFIVSDNVYATAWNVDASFANSDHNPVLLRFSLNAPREEAEGGEESTEGEEG